MFSGGPVNQAGMEVELVDPSCAPPSAQSYFWVPHPYPRLQLPAVCGCLHLYFCHPDLFPDHYLQLPTGMSTQAPCTSSLTLAQILLYSCLLLPVAFCPVT